MTRRIVVLLSGRGSNFQSLLNASLTGELSGSIDLVISNRPQAGGLAIANNANIDTALIDHQAYATRDAFDADLAGVIDSVTPDLIVLAGFMRILTQSFVSQFAGRLLNKHPTRRPLYPGINTHQRALCNGDTHAGATVHYVTGELDGGPSVIQAKVPIESGDTKDRLADRILQVEHQIYPQAVNWHLSGRLALRNGVLYKDSVPLPATGELWRAPQ